MKSETNLHLCFFDSYQAASDTKKAGKHRSQWLALDIVVHIHQISDSVYVIRNVGVSMNGIPI